MTESTSRSGQRWTDEEEDILKLHVESGGTLREASISKLARTPTAILARCLQLKLVMDLKARSRWGGGEIHPALLPANINKPLNTWATKLIFKPNPPKLILEPNPQASKWITFDTGGGDTFVSVKDVIENNDELYDSYHKPNPNQESEITMSTIETKTFIAGTDASQLSDAQIFERIARIESSIEQLKKIKAKSKKLDAAISAMEADIQKLVEYVDGR